MALRNNMILSVILHATALVLGVVLLGRGAISRAPQQYIAVTLLKDERVKKQTSGDSVEELFKKKAPVTRKMPVTKRDPITSEKPERASRKVSHEITPRKDQPSAPPPDGGDIIENIVDPTKGRSSGAGATEQAGRITGISGPPSGTTLFEDHPGSSTEILADDGENEEASGKTMSVSLIRTAIEKSLRYPVLARKRGIEGTVIAEFGVDERGLPGDLKVLRSSGWEVLDSAALDTVVRAAPFPHIKGKIEIPITFKLK